MSDRSKYAVACRTDWFWDQWSSQRPAGEWLEIRDRSELTLETLRDFGPTYVFFPHWSHFVPEEIFTRFECICFHAAPVPYGRGGSPVQNMIARGHEETELVALRMVETLDAGPVYTRRHMSSLGGGDEIFIRLAEHILELIHHIVDEEPEPEPQDGKITVFERRQPDDGRLSGDMSLREVFDYIRMLDAEGYPAAFIEYDGLRLEFSRPALRRGRIEADVVITAGDDETTD